MSRNIFVDILLNTFAAIGAAAVIVVSCFAWGYYSWTPKCGTLPSLVTKECHD